MTSGALWYVYDTIQYADIMNQGVHFLLKSITTIPRVGNCTAKAKV
ncbi:MAG TPA: hypothetical protein VGR54_02915 [Nitrosopumilaceae archaeon]|nr:hypothetical protein [Nitrosopumilaceae archaeon]